MRREGYELQVGQPQVIIKEIDGRRCEPVEAPQHQVPEEYSSKVIDMVTRRKGDIISMQTRNDRVDIEFQIPRAELSDSRNNVLTATAGEAIMAHRFFEYQPWKGDIERRTNGSPYRNGGRNSIRLRHRQAPGPRPLLHIPAGR